MKNLKNLWATQNITHCNSTLFGSNIFNNTWSAIIPIVCKIHKLKWSQLGDFCYNWTNLAWSASCCRCWSWYNWLSKKCTSRSILRSSLLMYIYIFDVKFTWWSCSCCWHQSLWSILFSHGCLLALSLFNFIVIV